MIEMLEEPQRDFESLVNETRQYLNALALLSPPAIKWRDVSQIMKTATPHFDWTPSEAEHFVIRGLCRFYEGRTSLPSPPSRPVLALEDVIALHTASHDLLEPKLKALRACRSIPHFPNTLSIEDGPGTLTVTFEIAGINPSLFERRFQGRLLRLAEGFVKAYKAEKSAALKL